MKRKVIIAISVLFAIVIITWTICFLLPPVAIIDGKPYDIKKINELSKQRELSYKEINSFLYNEINSLINDLYYNPIDKNIQGILQTFYIKSIEIDNTYLQLMSECTNKFSFPFQSKKVFVLDDIFPALITVIEYDNQIYNEFALSLLVEQYEIIARNIIDERTKDILNYISYFSRNSKTELQEITDFITHDYFYEIISGSIFEYFIYQCKIPDEMVGIVNISTNNNKSGITYFNVPAVKIDGILYSKLAVNELKESMLFVSPYILENIKSMLKYGIKSQTEIFKKNIKEYVNWYFFYLTRIDKTIYNTVGFFAGEKSSNEKYYIENFYRIINYNADFYSIIEDDLERHKKIILNIYKEYLKLIDYFSINIHQNVPVNMIIDDYIGPYINDIITYFENVFEALDQTDTFYHHEYTIKDNSAINTAKSTMKLLSGINFFGGLALDFIALKTQKSLNSTQLEEQIYDNMIQNQNSKVAIINDPFNYLYNKLKIGNVLFVDNYFASFNTYQHYGVYVGNKIVIHYAPLEGQEISFENGIIHETTLDKFLNGRALQIDTSVKNNFSEKEIIRRAYSRINEKEYDLFTNNCEHFARWCVTGEHISYQVINSPQKIENIISEVKDKYYMVSKFFELFN